ncbi:MAG: hypothetical protein WCG95_02500, partial [bacterium]
HIKNGCVPQDQKATVGSEVDQIIEIAIKNNESTEHLHCITMFLPENKLAEIKNSSKKILTHPNKQHGKVGTVQVDGHILHINKKTNPHGFETFTLHNSKGEEIGNILLNYYKKQIVNGKEKYSSSYGTYELDSPFALYGNNPKNNHFKNKVFAEFWSIDDKGGKYDGEAILKKLFQIAIEAGEQKGCPRLQVEADWDEHPTAFEYGFRTQDKKAMSAAEVTKKYITELAQSKAEKRAINTHQFGSVPMILDLEFAQKLASQFPSRLFEMSKKSLIMKK